MLLNAVLPAHAQRMRSLFASDKAFASLNISFMIVTLDVSQLSGWLNAAAYENM
jgi:hypothetical protein